MNQDPSISFWISEARQGNSLAANKIWNAYYQKLVGMARNKLRASSKRMADEEDLVAEAFQSFFRGASSGRFPQLEDRDDLWQILMMLTARKAANLLKHENRQKRGGGNVRGESIFVASDGEEQLGIDQVVGVEPTPEFADQVIQQCEEMLGLLGDQGSLREIAIQKMEGFTNSEIAEQLQMTTRTVERKLRVIREIFESADP